MPNAIDLYSAQSLARAVEVRPSVNTFLLSTFFDSKPRTFPTESIMIDIKKGGRQLAPFVHPRIGSKTVHTGGYETKVYTPPLLAPDTVTLADQYLKRMAGENIFSGLSPQKRAVEKLREDTRELKDQIVRREEWMAAQAIFTGLIPVIGEGVNDVIDFNFTNKETLTGTKKWGEADAKPLDDLARWHKQVQKSGFVNCDVVIMASDAVDKFLKSKDVQEQLDIKAYDLAVIQPKMLPNGATYIGSIRRMGLDIYEYNEWYLDDWTNPEVPEQKPTVPEGTVSLLSTRAKFIRNYAVLDYIDEKTENIIFVEKDIMATSYVARKPSRRILEVKSKPLPTPTEVDSWFVAEV